MNQSIKEDCAGRANHHLTINIHINPNQPYELPNKEKVGVVGGEMANCVGIGVMNTVTVINGMFSLDTFMIMTGCYLPHN